MLPLVRRPLPALALGLISVSCVLSACTQTPTLRLGAVFPMHGPQASSAREELRGVRRCGLARFGAVQLTIVERDHGFLRMELQDSAVDLDPGCDDAALAQGFVSVTPLRPIGDAADVPLPFPAEPILSFPGCALTAATKSLTVPEYGKPEFTTSV